MKGVITLLVLTVTVRMAFPQGTVSFQNNPVTEPVKQWTSTSDSTLVNVPPGGGSVQLIAAPKGTPLPHTLGTLQGAGLLPNPGWFIPNYSSVSDFLAANPGWAAVATTRVPTNPPIAGRFNGGTVTINNVDPWAYASYLVIGWTGFFSSYDLAYAAATADPAASFLGVSAILTTPTGNPFTTPPGTPGLLATSFTGMTLAPALIPEPTTLVLAALGAAALMIVRRRR